MSKTVDYKWLLTLSSKARDMLNKLTPVINIDGKTWHTIDADSMKLLLDNL